jgi:hypothetical protein
MIGKATFMASKAFAKKHYTSAVNAIKELKGPAIKYGSKVTKHIKKHPIKYAAGAAGAAGYGIYSSSKEMKPKLIKAFAQLPKSDPRYKSLKKAGYV